MSRRYVLSVHTCDYTRMFMCPCVGLETHLFDRVAGNVGDNRRLVHYLRRTHPPREARLLLRGEFERTVFIAADKETLKELSKR